MALCMHFVVTYIDSDDKKPEPQKTPEEESLHDSTDNSEKNDTLLNTPNAPVEDWVNDPLGNPATISATQSLSSIRLSRSFSHSSLENSDKLQEPADTTKQKQDNERIILERLNEIKEKGAISPDQSLNIVKFFSEEEKLRYILQFYLR